MVGYDRYEGRHAQQSMQIPCELLRLYSNFFQPVMRMTAKQRVSRKVTNCRSNFGARLNDKILC